MHYEQLSREALMAMLMGPIPADLALPAELDEPADPCTSGGSAAAVSIEAAEQAVLYPPCPPFPAQPTRPRQALEAALDKDFTLQQNQREMAREVRQRGQTMLLQLAHEKGLLYQKVGSFRAVAGHLEQLERQLRTSMPQHVMDMLGQQAAHMLR